MADDRILLNLVLNEATVSAVEGRVRNLVNRLNNQNISLNINGGNIDNIINKLNSVQQQMQRLNNTSVNINTNLTTQQQQYRLETERIRVAQQISVERERTLQTENRAIRALAEENRTMTINRNLTADINGNIQHTHQHIRNVNNATNDFATGLGRSLQYILQYRIITEMLNQITEAYRELKAVDSSMVGYRKVTGASESEVKSLTKEAFANASKYSRLASEYAESTERFAKAGYNDKSSELSELALLAENVGDIDNNLANEFIVSSDAAWQLNGDVVELTKILNMFNELSNKTATDVEKLASGITVSGSMFAQAGLSAQDYAAIVGTATSKTQRSGEEMSRAWRTIVMNLSQIRGTDIETGEIIDEDKLAKAEKTLNAVGIQIREIVNGQNELRNPMNVLKEIADKWHSLSSIQQSALAESISNKRQSNAFISVVENWKDVEKAIEITSESSNSAIRENEIYMDSWAAKQKKVSAEWSEFISHMSDVEIIKRTLDTLTSAINVLDTPLGRIVAQIVLVNTALAVSNRLWGAVRARSIVADILSIGLAEGSLGTAIQLVTGHLWEQAAAWLATPMGMATVACAGIFLLTSAITNYNKKLEENRQEMIESGKEASKLTKDLDGLVEQYRKLGSDGKLDNSDREQAYNIQQQINELLGEEVDYINLSNGGYEEQLGLLKKLQHEKANDKYAEIKQAKDAAKESLSLKAVGDIDAGLHQSVKENKAIENLLKDNSMEDYLGEWTNGYRYFSIDRSSEEAIIESYEKMNELKNILVKSYEDEIKSGGELEDFYNNLTKKISDLSDAVQKYKDAMSDYNINEAVIQFNETAFDGIKGAFVDSEESMTKWITSMINASDVTDGVQSELIALAKTWYPQYTAQIDEAVEAQAKATIQSALQDKSIAGNIDSLTREASALGLTEGAMIELVLAEIRFNKNNLNVSQKVSALKELCVWAGVAQAKMDSIFSVNGKSKMADKEVWAERNGVTINYNADKDGSHSYTYKGVTYSGVSAVNTILADEAVQAEVDKLGKVPTGGGVSGGSKGGGGSSSSDKNEALESYLDNIERAYKVHQDETRYINDLNYALDNLVKTEDERLDVLDKIDQAYKDYAENRVNDIEHQIELTKKLQGEEANVTVQLKEIQKISHDEANRLRLLGYDDNSNEVQEWQNKWWDAQDKIIDWDYNHSANWIEERNKYDDWHLFDDNEVKAWQRVLDRFTSQYPEQIDKIKEIEENLYDARKEQFEKSLEDMEEYIDARDTYNDWETWGDNKINVIRRMIDETKKAFKEGIISLEEFNDKILELEKSLRDELKTFATDRLEHNSSQISSLKTLLQAYYDVGNAVTDAQHEISKELAASKVMYEYLNEETRKLLFNQEDYNTLNEKLIDIQAEAEKLQNRYNQDILSATEENLEQITSQYEMQFDLLMKSYEISKAELEVAKKKQQLNNVLNERNVRMFINGQWQWVADTQNVINAQNELADAEYEAKQAQLDLRQTESMNKLTAAQDMLTTAINEIENGVKSLGNSLSTVYSENVPALGEICDEAAETIRDFANGLTGSDSSASLKSSGYNNGGKKISFDPNIDYSALMAYYEKGSRQWERLNERRNAKIDAMGLPYVKQYATGTRNTKSGNALMGEEGFEAFINNNGHLIPINQPTLFTGIGAGGTVFNTEQMANLRSLWDLSNIKTPDYSSLVNNNKTQNIDNRVDNSVHIQNLEVGRGVIDIDALRRYVPNH